tara:strand:+ start:17343 stop:18227 length:885 start_codon:yes stop_codon:yes gene_type:complete
MYLIFFFITVFTPTKNFSAHFDTILCARIFNPYQGFSLSIFREFKDRYKKRNIEYFREKYGMDYESLKRNQPEPCNVNEVEFLIQYKGKYPQSMFGASASLFKGCCWYVTNRETQDWFHEHAMTVYMKYLIDNMLYETALFIIDSGGFIYAKSYFMDEFKRKNPINNLFGNLLFAWTQPIMNAAVSTDDVNRDDRSNIRIRSWMWFFILVPAPYLIFMLGLIICVICARRIGLEAILGIFYLLFSMILSLLVVHFGNGMGFQRHAFWTNVLFNLIVYITYFLIIDSFVTKKPNT